MENYKNDKVIKEYSKSFEFNEYSIKFICLIEKNDLFNIKKSIDYKKDSKLNDLVISINVKNLILITKNNNKDDTQFLNFLDGYTCVIENDEEVEDECIAPNEKDYKNKFNISALENFNIMNKYNDLFLNKINYLYENNKNQSSVNITDIGKTFLLINIINKYGKTHCEKYNEDFIKKGFFDEIFYNDDIIKDLHHNVSNLINYIDKVSNNAYLNDKLNSNLQEKNKTKRNKI